MSIRALVIAAILCDANPEYAISDAVNDLYQDYIGNNTAPHQYPELVSLEASIMESLGELSKEEIIREPDSDLAEMLKDQSGGYDWLHEGYDGGMTREEYAFAMIEMYYGKEVANRAKDEIF